MATPTDESKIGLQSAIPTGPWTLYFHSPEETKWTLNTFISLGSMKTWHQFWSIIEALKTESFSDGMFFMMHDPAPPLWESHHNIRGGCYSFRCQKKEAADVYLTYIIASMLNVASCSPENRINGISISPKRGFNIIKLWNTDAQKFNQPSTLQSISSIRESEIIYTPFVQKKM
jgi:Eukaryotic initiation factor 4E